MSVVRVMLCFSAHAFDMIMMFVISAGNVASVPP
jgi:hypothetical protein